MMTKLLLLPLQPLLARMMGRVVGEFPGIFDRLGAHARKRFVIDARELPFLLLLEPDPARPSLRAVPRRPLPHCHAQISGPCRQLARLANGEMDGDAMFFSRDLHISGNLEAVVCLRNALDDVDGSVMDCICGMLPEPGRHLATRWRARGVGRRFARRLA